jgi:protein arginine kinase
MTFGSVRRGLPDPESLPAAHPSLEPDGDAAPWSRSQRYGFLASDPSRLGPGVAVEALVHLPALALSRQLPHARNYLAACGVASLPHPHPLPAQSAPAAPARDRSAAVADAALFRLRSRGGLGSDFREVHRAFAISLQPVLRLERQTRERCAQHYRKRLEDRLGLSFRVLSEATTLTYAEMSGAASLVRMGACLGLRDPQIAGILEELLVIASSGHLAVTSGRDLGKEEEDFARANVVRLSLLNHSGEVG